MAPLVVGNRVIVGPSGGELGIRGWRKALDLATGKVAWTAHNVGPDADMLVRPGTFKPFYDQGMNLASTSWPGETWKVAGAPVWGWLSYDAALDLVYFGVGNPGPVQRGAARRATTSGPTACWPAGPATGRWSGPTSSRPHDNWDYDSNAEMILADLTIAGRPRKGAGALRQERLCLHAGSRDRRGAAGGAVRGRELGEADRPRRPAGRCSIRTKLTGASRGTATYICPSLEGGKSPASPASYLAGDRAVLRLDREPLHGLSGRRVTTRCAAPPTSAQATPYVAGPGGNLGAFIAWDATTGAGWEIREHFPVWSGAVATGGNVVFYGTLDGWFKAADARTGRCCGSSRSARGWWRRRSPSAVPDGKQYVAVYAGIGGDWALLSGDVRSDDPKDVRDPADFVRDLGRHTSQGGMVWVFAL